jgi:hypothetical protein
MKHLVDAAVAWLRRQHGRRAEAVRLAYRRALAGETGRLVLDDLARLCHAGDTTFVEGDAVTTAFREGQRAVLLHVAAMLGLRAADLLSAPWKREEEES